MTEATSAGLTPQIVIPALLGIALIVSEVLGKTKKFKANGVVQAIIGILKLLTARKK